MGIYFPAVTGILAGTNRLGELRNASESIPKGTLAAWGFSTLIYLALTVVYACGADRATLLREDVMVVLEIAFPHKSFMAIAIMMSSIGAAVECLAGAPRNLYGIVEDGNLKFLEYFKGKFKLLVICNSFISLAATMAADIDFINPINTIFFLIPYGMLNFTAFLAESLQLPSWRPTYNYNKKIVSLAGFCMSLALMALIGGYYNGFALIIFISIYYYIHKIVNSTQEIREKNNFGDLFDALYLKAA
jgi:solute carrier family 12 (potassium/chloride transporter), member 4/6